MERISCKARFLDPPNSSLDPVSTSCIRGTNIGKSSNFLNRGSSSTRPGPWTGSDVDGWCTMTRVLLLLWSSGLKESSEPLSRVCSEKSKSMNYQNYDTYCNCKVSGSIKDMIHIIRYYIMHSHNRRFTRTIIKVVVQ